MFMVWLLFKLIKVSSIVEDQFSENSNIYKEIENTEDAGTSYVWKFLCEITCLEEV